MCAVCCWCCFRVQGDICLYCCPSSRRCDGFVRDRSGKTAFELGAVADTPDQAALSIVEEARRLMDGGGGGDDDEDGGRYAKAELCFTRALTRCPANVPIWLHRLECVLQWADSRSARVLGPDARWHGHTAVSHTLRAALILNPTNPQTLAMKQRCEECCLSPLQRASVHRCVDAAGGWIR